MRVYFRNIMLGGKRCHGECVSGEYIVINLLTQANVANAFIHEKLHDEHPEWSETKVRRETAKRWRGMNTRQRFNLYKELFNRKFRA